MERLMCSMISEGRNCNQTLVSKSILLQDRSQCISRALANGDIDYRLNDEQSRFVETNVVSSHEGIGKNIPWMFSCAGDLDDFKYRTTEITYSHSAHILPPTNVPPRSRTETGHHSKKPSRPPTKQAYRAQHQNPPLYLTRPGSFEHKSYYPAKFRHFCIEYTLFNIRIAV